MDSLEMEVFKTDPAFFCFKRALYEQKWSVPGLFSIYFKVKALGTIPNARYGQILNSFSVFWKNNR